MKYKYSILVAQAIQAFHTGNFSQAELILKNVIQSDSRNVDALQILGLIWVSQAKYTDALNLLEKAVRIKPNDESIQYNLAKALYDCGKVKESIPHHKKAVELAPRNIDAWLNYGRALFDLGEYENALDNFNKALRLSPNFIQALINKGACLNQLQQYENAVDYADKVLLLNPIQSDAFLNKAIALKNLKRYDEAIIHFDKALALKPDFAEAWSNKGNTLHELKRYEEALAADIKALALKPGFAEAWSNTGNTLHELKRYDEAIIHFDKALALKPDFAEAWSNKGNTLHELKRYDEAIIHFKRALNLKSVINWLYGDFIHIKMKICDWSNFAESLEDLSKKVMLNEKISQPFPLLALIDNPFIHKKSSEIFVQNKYPFDSSLGKFFKLLKKQKIRVGYYSADFRDHPVSLLSAELFELHDKERFEIIGFSFGIDDKSPMRHRLSEAFSQFIDVSKISNFEIAQLSRDMQIDIAVDLGGHTIDNRIGIFAYRAAPIQLSYLGYLGTMGAEYYDYLIADKIIIPENFQQFYKEKIFYLPTYQVNDRKRIMPDKKITKSELGIAENSFVFCCFNNNYKILPSTFDSWMRILKAVEGSIFFLYADSELSQNNLIKEAELRGVNRSRLIFGERVSLEKYLARYGACDLFLDTFPYNAGTTASDALWCGVPVLTLKGKSFASRVAASVLDAIGLQELISCTQEEYESMAIELAINPKKLDKLKSKLISNRWTTPLFDTPLFTRNLEKAYIEMYEQYLRSF